MAKKTTKEKILAAARTLFVEHGFAGTSIGKIAELAQINHSLIFHHFGNKENLWMAVKQNIVNESSLSTKRLPETNQPFPQFLKQLFIKNMQFYRTNPDIVRIINWQRLEYSDDRKIVLGCRSSEMKAWIEAFTHYQEKGEIDPQFRPEFIVILILSIISSAALDPNIYISKKKDREAYIDFCVARLIKTLKS